MGASALPAQATRAQWFFGSLVILPMAMVRPSSRSVKRPIAGRSCRHAGGGEGGMLGRQGGEGVQLVHARRYRLEHTLADRSSQGCLVHRSPPNP